MRLILRILQVLAIILCVAALGVGIYTARTWNKTWDVALPDLHASADPAVIAKGEYLVFGPAHCVECHVGSFEVFERYASGGAPPAMSGGYRFPIGPLGTLYSKNITPDTDTGIGRYSDPQIARMLRHGVRPDGRGSIPDFMPYGDMSDEDVVAILSFLRAQPPVRNVVPENEWTLFGKVMKAFVSAAKPRMDVHPPAVSPVSAPTPERGEYLARSVASCIGCHTPFNEMTGAPTGPSFSGGIPMEPLPAQGIDRALWFKPPNITPQQGSALLRFPDRDTFVARFRNGGRKHAGSPMPWEAMSHLTPEDAGALYEFLHRLPPSGEAAPEDPRVAH
jgi:mono/diheme cytochrome c family protein